MPCGHISAASLCVLREVPHEPLIILLLRIHQSMTQRQNCGLRAVGNPQLAENCAGIITHGAFGKIQPRADIGIVQTLREQRKHFALPFAGGIRYGGVNHRWMLDKLGEQLTGHSRVHVCLSFDHVQRISSLLLHGLEIS
jgi:hypothetical protein